MGKPMVLWRQGLDKSPVLCWPRLLLPYPDAPSNPAPLLTQKMGMQAGSSASSKTETDNWSGPASSSLVHTCGPHQGTRKPARHTTWAQLRGLGPQRRAKQGLCCQQAQTSSSIDISTQKVSAQRTKFHSLLHSTDPFTEGLLCQALLQVQ